MKTTGAGYALIDNSASDWGNKIEADVLSCIRCQKILFRQHTIDHLGRIHLGWNDTGAWCHRCDAPLCFECAAPSNPCPAQCGGFRAELDRAIEANYHRTQNAKILGI
jgi:hypothetical protein